MNEKYILDTVKKEGITQICHEFYILMKEDDLIGKMYPDDDWEGAEERLLDFLLFRIAGDQTYLIKRGHPRLKKRHAPFIIGEKERDLWMEIMDEAMIRAKIPEDIQKTLHEFFYGVADFMRNH